MKKAKAFLLNLIILAVTSLLMNSISMSFNVYISNKVGAEVMGIYQLIMSVFMFAVTLATSGIGLATTRLVSEELALGYESGAKKALRNCIFYALSFGLLSAVLLAANAEFIAFRWLHNKMSALPLYTLAVSLPFISVSSVFSGYFTAVRHVVKSASAQILEQFVKMIISVYALNLMLPKGLEMACFAIAMGSTLSEIISFLYGLILYLTDKMRYKTITGSGKNLMKRMFNISIPLALSSYIRSGLLTVKQIITPTYLEKSGLSCEEALAGYGMIHGMVIPVIMFPSQIFYSVSSLLIPEISRLNVSKNYARIKDIIYYTFKITIILAMLICGILFCFADEFSIALYKNSETAMYIKCFSLLAPIMYLDSIADGFLKGLDLQLSVVSINIIDTVSTIGLICFILPTYGINGYIAIIFVTEILNTVLSVGKLLKTVPACFKDIDCILEPMLAILLAVIISSITPSINLIVSIIQITLIYVLVLFIIGAFTKKDFQFIFSTNKNPSSQRSKS